MSIMGDAVGGLISSIGDQAIKFRQAVTGKDAAADAANSAAASALESLKEQGLQAVATAQAQIDVAETNVTGTPFFRFFLAGWRPLIGWTCGVAFILQYIVQPIATWIGFHFAPLDMSVPTQVVMGMLGLGTGIARSVEKINGAAGNH